MQQPDNPASQERGAPWALLSPAHHTAPLTTLTRALPSLPPSHPPSSPSSSLCCACSPAMAAAAATAAALRRGACVRRDSSTHPWSPRRLRPPPRAALACSSCALRHLSALVLRSHFCASSSFLPGALPWPCPAMSSAFPPPMFCSVSLYLSFSCAVIVVVVGVGAPVGAGAISILTIALCPW